MSIINQTLRELDARAPAVDAAAGGASITVPARRTSRVRMGMLLAGGGLIAIVLAVGLALTQTQVPHTLGGTGAPPPPLRAPAVRAAVPAPGAVPAGAAATAQAVPAAANAPADAPAPGVSGPTREAAAPAPTPPPAAQLASAAPIASAASAPPLPAPETGAPAAPDTRADRPRELKPAAISKQLTQLTPDEEAEARYRKALGLINKGRDDQARPLLEDALRLAPGHVAARQVLATLLSEGGQNREAEAIVREGRRVSPDTAWFALSLARLQSARGELDEAAATLRSGLGGRGVTADYHASYAAILSRLNQPVEAARQYEQALARQPGPGAWWMGLGLALSAQGRIPEARAAYGRALQTGNLPANLEEFVRAKLSE